MAQTLVILPSVIAAIAGENLFLDNKAVDGLSLYSRLWPGPVRCLLRVGDRKAIAFGREYTAEELPFSVEIVPDDLSRELDAFRDAAVVLASGDNHHDLSISEQLKCPVVYIIEYTLDTRLRINAIDNGFSLKAAKSALWIVGTEWRRRKAFRRSSGLQCNGAPAYAAYGRLTPSSLLYFDTRTADEQQISSLELAQKQKAVRAGDPLRIVFSGRLERMKGADHLIPVAEALNRLGVAFSLDIFGDGSLRSAIAQQIQHTGLGHSVSLHGAVSFADELMPRLKAEADLFLCCHRQADPSCTYLETLSCGLPIVGYKNEAFAGILSLGDVGLAVTMDDISGAAAAIATLDRDRTKLSNMAAQAARVGRAHSFEREFQLRIDHLRGVAEGLGQ